MLLAARISLLLGLAILASVKIGAKASPSFEVKHVKLCQTRLARNVKPLEYDIDLDLMNEFATVRGKIDIQIEFSPPSSIAEPSVLSRLFMQMNLCKAPSNEILLHLGENLEISSAKFQTARSLEELQAGGGDEIKIHRIARDNEKQMILIQLKKELSSSSTVFGRLTISYESLSPNPSLFVPTNWRDTDSERAAEPSHWLARLQSGQARNLFPCFDEPQLKASIKMKMTTTTDGVNLITNLFEYEPNRYQSTNLMPINGLVLAFISSAQSQFVRWRKSAASKLEKGIRISITGPKQTTPNVSNDGGSWALDFAGRCLDWFQESTKIKYLFESLDFVAIPSNIKWNISDGPGLSLINGKFLLIDLDADATEDERQRIASYERQVEVALNVALVVARQWFSWTLTPDGWSNLWISEGLAARAALQMVHQLEPTLEVYHYVRFNYLKRALSLEDGENYPPLSSDFNQARGQPISPAPFDMIRLVKATAIMQFLEKTIASDLNFDQTISLLLKQKLLSASSGQFNCINIHDLVEAFSNDVHSGDQILDLLKPWIELSGFPTFSVTTETNLRAISVNQVPVIRRNADGESVKDNAGQWPVALKFNYYSQMNLQANEVDLYETIRDNKLKRHKKKANVQIVLPDWIQNAAAAKVEINDDYETLPYYRIDCSKSGIACQGAITRLT